MDKVGECLGAQGHLGKRQESRLPPHLGQAVYYTLPSPANLHMSVKRKTHACPQSYGRGTLEHLLSSYPKALAEGWYCWHHYQVLKVFAESIALAISTSKHHHAPKKAISFIKAGEKPLPCPQLAATG